MSPENTQLFRYWDHLRGQRIAPARFDIDAGVIGGLLRTTFILDSDWRFRLAGTQVELWHGPQRGAAFKDLWGIGHDRTLNDWFGHLGGGGIVEIGYSASTDVPAADGRLFSVHFQLLILPLTHMDGRIERYIGNVSTLYACVITEPMPRLTLHSATKHLTPMPGVTAVRRHLRLIAGGRA
jgi:hypothetical protein